MQADESVRTEKNPRKSTSFAFVVGPAFDVMFLLGTLDIEKKNIERKRTCHSSFVLFLPVAVRRIIVTKL